MNRKIVLAFIALNGLVVPGKCVSAENELSDSDDRLNYAIGMDIGQSLRRTNQQLDLDILERALRAAYSGNEKPVNHSSVESKQRLDSERAQLDRVNREEGEAFLMVNREQPGVHVTTSGLQYKVIEPGAGPKPLAGSTVTVHYQGMFLDGSEFASSYKQGKPVTFQLEGVIPGWSEGLKLMSEGARYKFFIPSELAYGEQGHGEVIGPNETLIYEVELLDID